MYSKRHLAMATLLVCLTPACLFSADKTEKPATADDVARVAAMIDKYIAAAWEKNGVTPAPVSNDAEFARRVYLNIAGRIPRVGELHAFLNDKSRNKRRKLVAELLESPGYITHYTAFWREVLLPEVRADFQSRFLAPGFESWLREKLHNDTKYDALVKQLLTVKFGTGSTKTRAVNFYQRFGQASPMAFYQAKQAKPENLAAAVSKMFLGVRIECAQCHNHPFDAWKQEQFWGMAAFFAGLQRRGSNVFGVVSEVKDRREITIPDSEKTVQAAFLNGKQPQWRFRQGARDTLANWVTAKENPYFAKTGVNRIWGKLFGIGIVDPVDDFGTSNPASHPELLNALAKEFVAHKYDVKFLIKALTASRTYQLTSRNTHASQSNPQLFSRMAVQGMTPEQLFDSLSTAVGYYQPYQQRNPFVFGQNDSRTEIVELFRNTSEAPTERTTTILQALALMNGKFIADATSVQNSRTLAAVIDYPLADTAQRIEMLYLTTLSRKPRKKELTNLVKYVNSGGPKKDKQKALADVFWALLNSSEFMLNH